MTITVRSPPADTVYGDMEHARIDISRGLDGEPVVFACFDLSEEQVAASTRAVGAVVTERFRTPDLSADDVLELRQLTALADELGEFRGGPGTVVLRPARLSAYRGAVAQFVETRDAADWVTHEDRGALLPLRTLLAGLEQLCAEATRAALAADQQRAY